jgi:hypothetical protein
MTQHTSRYLNLSRDVKSEAANWGGVSGGPVEVFLYCISSVIGEEAAPPCLAQLGFRELTILGSWLKSASNLGRAELEELFLALTEA